MKKKMTPKFFRTFTSGAAGESGYYVEVAVFGGILTLDKGKGECYYTISTTLHFWGILVILITSKDIKNPVSIDALRELQNIGLCQLVSPAASSSATLFPSLSLIANHQRTSMLCDSDVEDSESEGEETKSEELVPKHCPRAYPSMETPSNLLLHLTTDLFSVGCSCSNFIQGLTTTNSEYSRNVSKGWKYHTTALLTGILVVHQLDTMTHPSHTHYAQRGLTVEQNKTKRINSR